MDIDLSKVEYMRDYIAHLKFARERLIDTYSSVRQHSQFVADNVWQDSVCQRFMEILDQKQNDLYRITEALEHYREVMQSQVEIAEEMDNQSI